MRCTPQLLPSPDTAQLTRLSLFDMDGTLVNSTAGVVGAWELFRKKYPTIDVNDILSCM